MLNGAQSWLTSAFPSAWLYVLGGIFVLVTLYLPKGLMGLTGVIRRRPGAGRPAVALGGGASESAAVPTDVVSVPAAVPASMAAKDATP